MMRMRQFTWIIALVTLGAFSLRAQGWTDGKSVVKPKKSTYGLGMEGFGLAAISPDGKTLAFGVDYPKGAVRLWDITNERELATFTAHTGEVEKLEFSPDGKELASAADRQLKLWDIPTGKERATLRGHTDTVQSIMFSPDNKFIATIADAGILWDAKSGVDLADYPDCQFTTFSRDAKTICVRGVNNIATFDISTGKKLAELDQDISDFGGDNSPDGRIALRIRWDADRVGLSTMVFDCTSGDLVATLKGVGKEGSEFIAPDGRSLAFVRGATVNLWDITLPMGKMRATIETSDRVLSASFSPTSDTLALRQFKTVTLWDAATGRRIANLKGLQCDEMVYSSDGKILAIKCSDAASDTPMDDFVKVFEARSGKELLSVKMASEKFLLSPDGRIVVLFGPDGFSLFDLTKLPPP